MSRKIEYILSLLIMIEPHGTHARAQSLASLTREQLGVLHEKAKTRVNIIDEYNLALRGSFPQQSVAILNSGRRTFLTDSSVFRQDIDTFTKTEPCRQYADSFHKLLEKLEERYADFWKTTKRDSDRPLLQAKIQVLEHILISELTIISEEAQGNSTSNFPYAKPLCNLVASKHLVDDAVKLKDSANFLSSNLWGQRGLERAFPLSTVLLKKMNDEVRLNTVLGISRAVAETILLLAGGNLVAPLIIEGGSLLRGTLFAGTLAYGAYRGYTFQNRSSEDPHFSNLEAAFEFSVENILDLGEDDIESYYSLIKQLEDNTLNMNVSIVKSLQPEIDLAKERYGSLDEARRQMMIRLNEIELIENRGNLGVH